MPPAATPAAPPPVATVVKVPPPKPAPIVSPSPAPPPVVAPASLAKPPAPAGSPHHSPAAPNVARFIAAASQDSTVQLTADGKLPELSLAEATAKKAKPAESNTSPLVLGLALVASTVMSILLLVADFGGGSATTETADQAREALQAYYVREDGAEGPLLPYQQLLKDASLAHSLRKFDEEQERYRQVLSLLRSEAKNEYSGLTGTKSSDKELQKLLGIVLDEGSR